MSEVLLFFIYLPRYLGCLAQSVTRQDLDITPLTHVGRTECVCMYPLVTSWQAALYCAYYGIGSGYFQLGLLSSIIT